MMRFQGLVALLAVSFVSVAPACDAAQPASAGEGAQEAALTPKETFLYFRCNATGWDLGDANRLQRLDPASGFPLVLGYAVTEDWMVDAGDTCVFSETDERNGYGTLYREWSVGTARAGSDAVTTYGPSVRNPLRAPTGSADEITHFTVRYAFKGKFQIAVMPYYDEYRFYISALPSS